MRIGIVLTGIGVLGLVRNRRNIIKILMSIELMLLGVNMIVLLGALALDDVKGLIMGIVILTVAAAEAAVGLGILVRYYRIREGIDIEKIRLLQG